MGLESIFGGKPKDNSAEILRRQQAEAEQRRLDETKSRLDREAQVAKDIAGRDSKRRAFVNSLVGEGETDPRKKYLQAV